MAPSCRPRGCSLALALAIALAIALAFAPLLARAAAQDAAQETFDPDVDLNTPQTVRRYGYPAEAHVVETADGYLLTLHRIPGPRLANASEGTAQRPVTSAASPSWTTEGTPWTSPSGRSARSVPTSTLLPPTPSTTTTSAPRTTSAEPPPATSTSATFTSTSPSPTATTTITSPTTDTPTSATTTISPPPPTTTTSPPLTTTTTPPSTTSTPSTYSTTSPPLTTTSAPPTSAPPTSAPTPPPTYSTTSPPLTTTTTSPPLTTTSSSTTSTPPPTITTTILPIPTTTAPNTTTPTTTTTTTTTTPSPPTSRPVIFLQHGLLGSSYDWIVAGPDKGLAYLLADAGYDVWMGNARGNTYSRAHVYLPTESSSPFWDFSFHEMGVYDLPAVFDYVLNATGAARLHYVGHSMGTTMFFAMAAAKPEAAAGVASMHALAPVVYVRHIKSPIRLLAPFARDVQFLAGLLGDGEFLPQNKILHYLAKYGCELLETERDVCENLIFILCGYDKPQFNTSILPVLLSHTPAGASTRTLIHYAQMIKSGKFQQYDLGKYGNLKKYRSLEPPTYDLSKVNVSVHLVYANNDWLAAPVDVNTLYEDLHCTKTKYMVPLSSFNHLDFILAKDVKTLLYDKLLKDIPRDIDYQNYEDNFLYD